MNLQVRRQRFALVIPCYNEAQRLNRAEFREFIATDLHGIELVFVDDGSRDATLDILKELAVADPERMHVTRLVQNAGKAEAVRQGMLWSLEQNFDVVAFWDADLATPLNAVPEFLRVLDRHPQVEVVWGTRLPLLGRVIDRDMIRRQIGRLNSALSAVAAGVPIRDALCGAKMFRNTPRLSAILSEKFQSRWVFDVELLARLSHLVGEDATESIDQVMYEFPLDRWDEIGGSKLKASDFAKAFIEVAAIFLKYRTPLGGESYSARIEHRPTLPVGLKLETVAVGDSRQELPADISRAA